MASTGGGGVGRVLLRPVTSWPGLVLTTLMPLGYQGGVWWLRARLVTNLVTPELSMAALTNQFERGGLEFDIEQAAGTGEFHQLARLRLTEVVPGRDMAFDPTLNTVPGVQLLPRWLTDFRRALTGVAARVATPNDGWRATRPVWRLVAASQRARQPDMGAH